MPILDPRPFPIEENAGRPAAAESMAFRLMRFFQKPRHDKLLAVESLIRHVLYRIFPFAVIPIKLHGGQWWLVSNDVCSRSIFSGTFDLAEQACLATYLQPGMTFIDIGAHHGFYTLLASRMVQQTGRVVAFEPSPRERRRLRTHVRINRCGNVRIEDFALGRESGFDLLYVVRGWETGCNSRRQPVNVGTTTALPVRVTSLDEYCKAHAIETIDFIKLDAEGAELEILEGMTDILSRPRRPLLLCEVDDLRTQPWGYGSERILEYLRERDYEWFGLRADGIPVSLEHKECYNLLAVPVERIRPLSANAEAVATEIFNLVLPRRPSLQ